MTRAPSPLGRLQQQERLPLLQNKVRWRLEFPPPFTHLPSPLSPPPLPSLAPPPFLPPLSVIPFPHYPSFHSSHKHLSFPSSVHLNHPPHLIAPAVEPPQKSS
ncbi:unnamed protein product [Closterium sp. NIES-64]|nr:unnamed protein product [Closterium sp. NIES-64]